MGNKKRIIKIKKRLGKLEELHSWGDQRIKQLEEQYRHDKNQQEKYGNTLPIGGIQKFLLYEKHHFVVEDMRLIARMNKIIGDDIKRLKKKLTKLQK